MASTVRGQRTGAGSEQSGRERGDPHGNGVVRVSTPVLQRVPEGEGPELGEWRDRGVLNNAGIAGPPQQSARH
jgi:hypothetical protein